MRKTALVTSISIALSMAQGVAAQEQAGTEQQPAGRQDVELERITVRAFPFARTALESAEPVQVLAGEALDDRRGVTLGETLQNEPGVHSSYYGPGAGRPIIRGLGGPRVRILEDGLSTADASAPSDDHAVSLDPMLVDQIEILRGPATLLYGSDAVGGVVNTIDNRIPEQVPADPFGGRFEARGDTVADERSGVLRLDGGAGNFVWHIDGTYRDTNDYEIPGAAFRELSEDHDSDHDHEHDDDHDSDHDGDHDGDHDSDHDSENVDGRLENSFVESQSGTIGASWVGNRGFLGASFRRFETEYGIPAPHSHAAHDHEHDDEHDHEHDEEHDHDHENGEEEGFAFIDMEQNSWDLKGALDDPMPGFARAKLRLGYNDYQHKEVELEDHDSDHDDDNDHDSDHDSEHDSDHDNDHESTTFDIETFQARLELETTPLAGWAGAVGFQYDDQDFVATGEEAFVPPNETESIALFALQERSFGDLTLSVGGRLEHTDVTADLDDHDSDHESDHDSDHDHENGFDIDDRTFTTWSASAGALWQIDDSWQTSLNFSRAERAPSATELFANGPHLATFTFERGDPTLNEETTNAWDLGIHRHAQAFDFEVNLFHKDITNFIFLEETGEERDGLPLRQTRQENVEFYGLETTATWRIHDTALGDFDLRGTYDLVRAELDDGDDLPRISPDRFLAGLDWHRGPWRGGLEWQRVFRQENVAEFEGDTPGYNLLNASLAYTIDLDPVSLELFAQGRNLGDNEARVHTSFLREFAPLPGRNFRFGVRGRF